jgi:hypothetical protein
MHCDVQRSSKDPTEKPLQTAFKASISHVSIALPGPAGAGGAGGGGGGGGGH